MKVGMTRENIRHDSILVEDPATNRKNPLFVDPRMVGILIILALMFVIICAVLQMFSRLELETTIKINIYDIHIIFTTLFIIIMFQSSVYREQIHIQHSQREADEFYIPERSCPPSYKPHNVSTARWV